MGNPKRTIEVLVDSGANDSFMPAGMFTDYPVVKTGTEGTAYKIADNGRITTLGEKFLNKNRGKGTEVELEIQRGG